MYGESPLAVALTSNFSPAFLAVLTADTLKYFNTVAPSHVAAAPSGVESPDVTSITGDVPPLNNVTALALKSVESSV